MVQSFFCFFLFLLRKPACALHYLEFAANSKWRFFDRIQSSLILQGKANYKFFD